MIRSPTAPLSDLLLNVLLFYYLKGNVLVEHGVLFPGGFIVDFFFFFETPEQDRQKVLLDQGIVYLVAAM